MFIQEPVQAAIWHCLNHYDYADAIFLAERLRAEVDSDETLFLLATCYYRSGKPSQAYTILQSKGSKSAQCKFLLAKCCLDLHKFSEAESILTGGDVIKSRNLEEVTNEFGEHAAFALQLIAKICYQTERSVRAAEACKRALKLNPFLWSSFELLCDRGEKPDPNRIFQTASLDSFTNCHGTSNQVINTVTQSYNLDRNLGHEPSVNKFRTPAHSLNTQTLNVISNNNSRVTGVRFLTPDENPQLQKSTAKMIRHYSVFSGNANFSPLTPSFGILPLETPSPCESTNHPSPPYMIPSSLSTLTEANDQKNVVKILMNSYTPSPKPVFSQSGNQSLIPSTPAVAPPLQSTQNVRRSSRLHFSNSYSVKENNKSPNRNQFATPKSPLRKSKTNRVSKTNKALQYNELNEKNNRERSSIIHESMTNVETNAIISNNAQNLINLQKQSVEGLMQLLKQLGGAYVHLAQYNCRKAIESLKSLPSQHFNTGFVLSLMGRAYFELSQYQNCIKYFQRVRELEPHRDRMMEIYSTALWHLQQEVKLSALAQELVALDKNSAATWCVTGNCFSTQKEHDTAIKFFQRAIQVDPNFAYAYTFLGHEYVATEELDKALNCFRNAVRLDPRHYNAWFGIGAIFFKQEKYQLCEIHYKRALQCNPNSSVLMCHMGLVQNALKKADKAIKTLTSAIQMDPANASCKFHRAQLYFGNGRHAEALKELEELKELAPKESLVYYLTGKVHKKLGNTDLALMHFSWATDLDPKGVNNQIKETIDPAMNRSSGDDAGDEFASEVNSAPVEESSSQEDISREFPLLQQIPDSDESL